MSATFKQLLPCMFYKSQRNVNGNDKGKVMCLFFFRKRRFHNFITRSDLSMIAFHMTERY